MKKRIKCGYLLLTTLLFFSTAYARELIFEESPVVTEHITQNQQGSTQKQEVEEEAGKKENSLPAQSYEVTHPIPAKDRLYPCSHQHCYWNTPMDIRNTQAIWDAMMEPMIILEGNEKKQYYLRESPSTEAKAVGEITYASQGVHVLETLDNGWSFVETYSSSFHGSKIEVWGDFVQGYVETKLLKEKPAAKEYGIVIDKLTQRMYILKEGELYTTMAISTGLANEKQPFNETRSGEYAIVSAVGAFMSDNLVCELALRYNAGDLIHKVPYILRGDTKYFDSEEPKLGERASHGCVRVQRKRTPEGINQDWLWANRAMGTRVWIWEDYQGRQVDVPESSLPLYYNPNGGQNYHSQQECYGVKDKYLPLAAFTYGQLGENPYASLTPCQYCIPPLRPESIEEKNLQYAK
ncbi:MAG: L,D-transpeptidase family protein [Clostridiales bacterium]|nr:L,D-transpeptidase family protein [Clostridiales bacterium]